MSLPGSILLVGEGNFSFSASLSQQHNETATRVTATCLQREEEALRHEGAAENIQIINSSGMNDCPLPNNIATFSLRRVPMSIKTRFMQKLDIKNRSLALLTSGLGY